MYRIFPTSNYRKSVKKLAASGKFSIVEVDKVVNTIAAGKTLDKKHKDHQLKGEFKDYRECHISNDLLLMYRIENEELILVLINIGSHSQLFG